MPWTVRLERPSYEWVIPRGCCACGSFARPPAEHLVLDTGRAATTHIVWLLAFGGPCALATTGVLLHGATAGAIGGALGAILLAPFLAELGRGDVRLPICAACLARWRRRDAAVLAVGLPASLALVAASCGNAILSTQAFFGTHAPPTVFAMALFASFAALGAIVAAVYLLLSKLLGARPLAPPVRARREGETIVLELACRGYADELARANPRRGPSSRRLVSTLER